MHVRLGKTLDNIRELKLCWPEVHYLHNTSKVQNSNPYPHAMLQLLTAHTSKMVEVVEDTASSWATRHNEISDFDSQRLALLTGCCHYHLPPPPATAIQSIAYMVTTDWLLQALQMHIAGRNSGRHMEQLKKSSCHLPVV